MPSATIRAYPDVRLDRGESAIPLGAGLPLGVSVRIWPYLVDASIANSRTTIVSPPFRGPLLAYELAVRHPGALGSFGGLAVFWATDDGGAQQNGPTTNRPSGTPLFEPAVIASTVITDLDEIPEHIVYANPGADPTEVVVMRPRKLIRQPDQIFFKVTIRSHPAGGAHARGWIIVAEGDSEDALRNFS